MVGFVTLLSSTDAQTAFPSGSHIKINGIYPYRLVGTAEATASFYNASDGLIYFYTAYQNHPTIPITFPNGVETNGFVVNTGTNIGCTIAVEFLYAN